MRSTTTVRDRRPGESDGDYLTMLKGLEQQLADYLALSLRSAHDALTQGDYGAMHKILVGGNQTLGQREMVQQIVAELDKLHAELARRIRKVARPGSPALADASAVLAQGVAIAAAAKVLGIESNRPPANIRQVLQAAVNEAMQRGEPFDTALETGKDTISRRVFAGSA